MEEFVTTRRWTHLTRNAAHAMEPRYPAHPLLLVSVKYLSPFRSPSRVHLEVRTQSFSRESKARSVWVNVNASHDTDLEALAIL